MLDQDIQVSFKQFQTVLNLQLIIIRAGVLTLFSALLGWFHGDQRGLWGHGSATDLVWARVSWESAGCCKYHSWMLPLLLFSLILRRSALIEEVFTTEHCVMVTHVHLWSARQPCHAAVLQCRSHHQLTAAYENTTRQLLSLLTMFTMKPFLNCYKKSWNESIEAMLQCSKPNFCQVFRKSFLSFNNLHRIDLVLQMNLDPVFIEQQLKICRTWQDQRNMTFQTVIWALKHGYKRGAKQCRDQFTF